MLGGLLRSGAGIYSGLPTVCKCPLPFRRCGPPGPLVNVTYAASFVALSQQNWAIASEELFRRLATYQNGTPNTLNGPRASRTWSVGAFRRFFQRQRKQGFFFG